MNNLCFMTNLTSSEWASWAQAAGVIFAIGGAYLVGERQAKAAFANDLNLRREDLRRKNGSLLAIASAAQRETCDISAIYKQECPAKLLIHLTYNEKVMEDILNALAAIPIHEFGSYEAVTAFLNLRNNMIYLQRHVANDIAYMESGTYDPQAESDAKRSEFSALIQINCRLAGDNYEMLKDAFDAQHVEVKRN